jgi:hypothetical protein
LAQTVSVVSNDITLATNATVIVAIQRLVVFEAKQPDHQKREP